jgi:hypothetical protein
MYALHVLNDANEWELIDMLFASEAAALAFYAAELDMFWDCKVTKMKQA